MKRKALSKSAFACLLMMAFVLVLPTVQPVFAQSAITTPEQAFMTEKRVMPDIGKGELTRLEKYMGDTLFRREITYRDGSHSSTEFHPNGIRKGEMIRTLDGTVTVKLFNQSGEGLFRVNIIKPGVVEQLEYRPDGETLWFKQTIGEKERATEYFDDTGRMRVKRLFKQNGTMNVTVFSGSGSVAYEQVWIPGVKGYVLDKMMEPLENGESRSIIMDGRQVDRCDYLNKGGTVLRTEDGATLSSPVDKKRLREFAPHDDPTIPAKNVPTSRIKK